MLKKSLALLVLVASPALADAAQPLPSERCPNCEAIVTLAPAQAQTFATTVLIINSLPLHGLVLDAGGADHLAKVVVATDPSYARENHLDSFDVAKKALGFADDPRFGIQSVTAIWQRPTTKRH